MGNARACGVSDSPFYLLEILALDFLFGCCWSFLFFFFPLAFFPLDFVVYESGESLWISSLRPLMCVLIVSVVPWCQLVSFPLNKEARSLDTFVNFPAFLTNAVILKSHLEYYPEMAAYIMIGRSGRWSFPPPLPVPHSPGQIKGFRCEIIIIKTHFYVFSFIQQSD